MTGGVAKVAFGDTSNPPFVLYGDIRDESYVQCDGRILEVHPEQKMDVTQLPFPDDSFALVVFDPPHLKYAGERSYMRQSYGVLPEGDPLAFLQRSFRECWRVLRHEGTLIFKWNDNQVPLHVVLSVFGQRPLFGNRKPGGKKGETFWMVFFKQKDTEPAYREWKKDPELSKQLGIFDTGN